MKKIIIFGAGRRGEEALHYYGVRNVAYFCDNHKKGRVKDIDVIDFPELQEIYTDYDVVLAVQRKKYKCSMRLQLEDAGIEYEEFISLEEAIREDNFKGKYIFRNRSRGSDKLLMVLAGYKPFLWDSVFARVQRYTPDGMDICVMTAGYDNETLEELCEKNNWSYLYTYENKLSLAQNLTIRSHPSAKWIYKMDEDIFVTPGAFDEMLFQHQKVSEQGLYSAGFVAPVMQVNSYGYNRVLEYSKCREEYISLFGAAQYGRGQIYTSGASAEYLWDKTLPVNKFAEKLKSEGRDFSICYHRFGIGCILFEREIWEQMGGFKIASEGVLGIDEEYLCHFMMETSRAIVVAEKAFAGHFGYGVQTEHMKKVYERRREDFDN